MEPTLQTMKKLATTEAIKLKKELSETEIKRLSVDDFDPTKSCNCIYGMATGDCNSERAKSLIKKCCAKVYSNEVEPKYFSNKIENFKLNGKPFEVSGKRSVKYLSPMETLIFPENGGVESGIKIINYLKGETKTLSL